MPHLDQITFRITRKVDGAVQAFQNAHAVDMAFDLQLPSLKKLQPDANAGKIKMDVIPQNGAEELTFNLCANDGALCDSPSTRKNMYTADKALRHAVIMGIDRNKIIDDVALGKTTIPRDSWIYLGIPAIDDPSIPTTRFDVAAANQALDTAGYRYDPRCDGGKTRVFPDGSCITMSITTTLDEVARLTAQADITQDLAKIGIKVASPPPDNVAQTDLFNTFAAGGILANHAFDAALFSRTASTPGDPDSYYDNYSSTSIPSSANGGIGTNFAGENNPALDKAFDTALGSVDFNERAQQYKQAERLLAQDLPDIPLYQRVAVNAYTNALQGVRGNDEVLDYNTYDWYCTSGNCQSS
jgi:ABC-type transport system substrate-binding protein